MHRLNHGITERLRIDRGTTYSLSLTIFSSTNLCLELGVGGSLSGKGFTIQAPCSFCCGKHPLFFEGPWSRVTFLRAGSLPMGAKVTVRALFSVGEQKMMSVSS